MTAAVGEALYITGGFNSSEPNAYWETYRLRSRGGRWVWRRLEKCDLPWPACGGASAVIGSKIYLFAAADYFKAPGTDGPDFHTGAGRDNLSAGRTTGGSTTRTCS
jgi:hypothetical protein